MEIQLKSTRQLKPKIKRTFSIFCYFPFYTQDLIEPSPDNSSDDEGAKAGFIRASSIWIRNRVHDLPEIGIKCLNFFARIANHHHHRRCIAADFRYDPSSYALNFEDGCGDTSSDEARMRNFTSRLPASPPLATMPELSTALVAI